MTKKKYNKLLTKYGTDNEVKRIVAENKKVRKPFWIIAGIIFVIGIALAIMSWFNVF